MSKNKNSSVVYSTNPNFSFSNNEQEEETLLPKDQDLRVMRNSKHRGGKTVTIVTGFVGSENAMNDLAKMLKTKCGVGGTAKDGEIIIQGDLRDKIFDLLVAAGYKTKKAGG